jgi:hypothetical protein
MKTLLTSVLGLAAMTSVALASEPVYLTESQMDMVTAGQTVSLSWTASGTGSGPNNVSITNEATGEAAVVGGLAPSSTGSLSGTFTVKVD